MTCKGQEKAVVVEGGAGAEVPAPEGRWGTRYTFALMGFLGFVITFINRVDLSVAIVAMVYRGRYRQHA